MSDLEIHIGAIYRSGMPTAEDYAEAIQDLKNAASQLAPDGNNCAVCEDTDHQAWECHHNPLVMARRAAKRQEAGHE